MRIEDEVTRKLKDWQNRPVRIHVYHHGVGINYSGFLELTYEANAIQGGFGPPPLPDIIALNSRPRAPTPLVILRMAEFPQRRLVPENGTHYAELQNPDAHVRIVIAEDR